MTAIPTPTTLRVDAEFRALIPPLTAEERDQLEASIVRDGCRDPLVTWDEPGVAELLPPILLDGHNRREICEANDLPFETTPVALEDRLAASIWIRQNQCARRNLTDDQRTMNADALAELMGEQAKRDRAKAGRAKGGKATDEQKQDRLSDAATNKRNPPIDNRAVAAKSAGVSERKMKQARIVRKADPVLAKKVERGEVKLADAVRSIKRETVVRDLESIDAKAAKAAAGVYDVLVIDPPWAMEKIDRDCRENQAGFDYPTMSESEIAAVKLPCAENCHAWLWTTHKFLPMAFRLLDAWGLKYVCTFVWHKPGGFQPFGLPQYNCEFCIYARRGAPQFIDTKALPTCFNAPRGKHSEKPDEFYDTIRRVTAGRRLDMFNRREIDGFDRWGNQADE